MGSQISILKNTDSKLATVSTVTTIEREKKKRSKLFFYKWCKTHDFYQSIIESREKVEILSK
jgi:hypothetical protein